MEEESWRDGCFPGGNKRYSRQFCWSLLIACLFAIPHVSLAQSYFGTVTGVLTDPTGAVIPGVRLILTDQEKGYAYNAKSDGEGRYLYRSVPPGVYSLTAEMPGFTKLVRTGIHVDVNVNATADISLKLSSSSQTVEVNAQARRSTRRTRPPAWWSTESSSTICR